MKRQSQSKNTLNQPSAPGRAHILQRGDDLGVAIRGDAEIRPQRSSVTKDRGATKFPLAKIGYRIKQCWVSRANSEYGNAARDNAFPRVGLGDHIGNLGPESTAVPVGNIVVRGNSGFSERIRLEFSMSLPF